MDTRTQFRVQHLAHIFVQVVLLEDLVPLFVDAIALGVEHIVVFQEVFAHIKVGAFHPGLAAFDNFADEPHLDGETLVKTEALEHAFHLPAAKKAHQVIIQGQVETAGPGVALAGSAAA